MTNWNKCMKRSFKGLENTFTAFCGHKSKWKEHITDLLLALAWKNSICISNVSGLSGNRGGGIYSQSAQRHLHRRAHVLINVTSDLPLPAVDTAVVCASHHKNYPVGWKPGQTLFETDIIFLFRRTRHGYFLLHIYAKRPDIKHTGTLDFSHCCCEDV